MNKQTSLCIKAIAIIMMVATHLFGLYASSSIISITLPNGRLFSSYIGYACGLCVALFAFLTGFGLQKSFEGKSIGGVYLYSLKKIVVFLLEYWVILFSLFFPFYACTVAGAVDWMMILRSLIGWGGGSHTLFLVRVLLSRGLAHSSRGSIPIPEGTSPWRSASLYSSYRAGLRLGLA